MNTEQTENVVTYKGTPEEVGAKLFLDAIGPTMHSAMHDSDVTRQQAARMMAGICAAFTGQMADNFGAEAAIDMLRGTADNLEKRIASGDFASTKQSH